MPRTRHTKAEYEALFKRFMHMRHASPELNMHTLAEHLAVSVATISKWATIANEPVPSTPRPRRTRRKTRGGPTGDVYELAGDDAFTLGDLSPIEAWDAAHECPHGYLRHQACRQCGRHGEERGAGYPGVKVLARAERRQHLGLPPRRSSPRPLAPPRAA